MQELETANIRLISRHYLKHFSELPKELENKKNETMVKISELKKVIAGTNPYITEINSLKEEVKKLKESINQNC